jgi:hypothetical protein
MNPGTIVVIFTSLLGVWALANIGYFLLVARKLPRKKRYFFFEMGAIWNVVNLIIAAVAIRFGVANYGELQEAGALATTQTTILALSIFANFVYIALGAIVYFIEPKHRKDRRAGWGLAIIAQGAFLLALDAMFIAALTLSIN